MVGMNAGLNLSNMDETPPEEVQAHISGRWRTRGPLYDLYATSLLADYSPDFLKAHHFAGSGHALLPSERGEGSEDRRNTMPSSVSLLHEYMKVGWETGIRNQFHVLRGWGFTRGQFMEIVMFSRTFTGMRGLGHVFHAIGESLPDHADGPGDPPWPDGWAADPAAFVSGLDMTTRVLTPEDEKNLTEWYERNLGYVPDSIRFGIKRDPQFLKAHRYLWEVAIRTLPKQVAPLIMLRDALLSNDEQALREATILGKAWGMSTDWLVRGVTHAVGYSTGLRGLYLAHAAMDDLLD
jgi:hypothetical protein